MEGESNTPYRRLEFENDNENLRSDDIGIVNEISINEPEEVESTHGIADNNNQTGPSCIPKALIPKIGMQFETEEDAYQYYLMYAKQVGFGIRRSKSYKGKSGKFKGILIDRVFCCSAEGKRRPDKRDVYVKAPQPETRFDCKAKMKVNCLQTGKFQVVEFIEDHTHYVSSPNKTHLHRSHRKISAPAAIQIEMAADVGIPPKASHDLMVRQAGGRENLGFIPEDYRNYLRSKRTREMKKGDTGGLLEYLHKAQLEDPNLFYAIQVDEDDLMTNIFWADAKMRNDYLNFGDVVCFDTTYKKNSEGRPLALFVGVNHHKQTTIFGVALLYDETTLTFEWLFNTFTKAMFDKKPTTILTDQDAAMAKALASKWPETNHRLCIWHIYQNAAIHLSGIFSQFKDFARKFSSCVYDFEDEDDFLLAWNDMLQKYSLEDNEWLKRMFRIKEKWALVYGRYMFCADMTTTQRSESMNSVIKRYVNYKHNLLQFFNHFQRLIDDRRDDELVADFKANNSIPVVASHVRILKHAASVYTPEVFKCIYDQWNKSHDPSFRVCEEVGTITKYEIIPVGKSYFHSVIHDSSNEKVTCSCRKFEFAGILCSHILKVFSLRSILTIPDQYILKRWTRRAKTGNYGDKNSNGYECGLDSKMLLSMRYKKLCALTSRLVTRAAERDDTSKIVEDHILSMLHTVDELLQGQGISAEKSPILQEDNLVQCSNLEKHPCNQVEIKAGETTIIRGLKVKKKTISRKRIKSGLENNSKKRRSTKKGQTSELSITPTPIVAPHNQSQGASTDNTGYNYTRQYPLVEQPSQAIHANVSSQSFVPTLPLSMGMTNLLMAQQSLVFDNLGASPCNEKCGCALPCFGGFFCICGKRK